MHQPGFSIWKIYIASMPGFLKFTFRIEISWLQMIPVCPLIVVSGTGSHDRITWICLIWTINIFGTSHSDTVIISRAAFCTHNIVVFATFSQMGGFDTSTVCTASPKTFRHTYNFLCFRIIFYNTDRTRFLVFASCLPLQCHYIFFTVIIMEHGCIKSCGMKINRFTPRTFRIFRCDNKIIYIKVSGVHGIHHTIYYIKQIFRFTICQTRCPDSLGTWQLLQFRIICILKRMGIKFPVFHIA